MGIESPTSTYALNITFPILTLILIVLRFHTRLHRKDGLRTDDWLCVTAWICLAGCCACLLVGQIQDAFVIQPIAAPDDVDPRQRLLAQLIFAFAKLYYLTSMFIKLSVLYFYRRIFIGRWFNIITLSLIIFTCVWGIYAFVGSVLYCGTTVHYNAEGGWLACPRWGFALQIGTYMGNAVIDLLLLVLPMPVVWKLQLPVVKKGLIIVVFLLGGATFVVSVINLAIQMRNLFAPALTSQPMFDGSWLLFYNLPVVESGVGLIVCNLPVLSFRALRGMSRNFKRGLLYLRHGGPSNIHSLHSEPPPSLLPTPKRSSNARWLGKKWAGSSWYRSFIAGPATITAAATTAAGTASMTTTTMTETFHNDKHDDRNHNGNQRSSSEEKTNSNRTRESSTTMGLNSVSGNESSMTDMWSAPIPGIAVPEPAETAPTARYKLEQTDSREGVVDSQNGKVIEEFDAD